MTTNPFPATLQREREKARFVRAALYVDIE
jgi:hypothetical protein